MAGNCVTKLDCLHCDGTDTVQVFLEDGERTGFCFKCKHYYNESELAGMEGYDAPVEDKPPQDISWVKQLRTLDNPQRGMKAASYRHFGVKHGLSLQDGQTISETYYPRMMGSEITGWKVRLHNPKKFYTLGSVRNAYPFGWKQALEVGGYNIYITEGEEDAVAVFTAFMREKKQKVAVISLSQGAASVIKTLQPIRKHLEDKFKQIVFLPDYDGDAGEQAVKDMQALFKDSGKLRVAKYSEKDANELIKCGKTQELVQACYTAGAPLSSSIKEYTLDDFEQIKEAPEFGLSYPYAGLTDLLRGIREGTTVYIGAPEKAGKSTLVNELGAHLMIQHKEPIFAIKPEESEEGTLRRMAGAAVGKVFYDPKVEVDKSAVDKAASLLAGKLFVLERNQTPNWDEVRQLMREAYLVRGIKYFFIDPITNFTAGLSSSDTDAFLKRMTREVAEDAKSLGYTVFLFCHFKKVKDGIAWSEGRVATGDDFAGSSSMVQSCDIAIAMQAWMLTEGDDYEYMNRRRVLHVIREREYNAVGKVELLWNSHRGKLEEVIDD